jgi:hypothetical protein
VGQTVRFCDDTACPLLLVDLEGLVMACGAAGKEVMVVEGGRSQRTVMLAYKLD